MSQECLPKKALFVWKSPFPTQKWHTKVMFGKYTPFRSYSLGFVSLIFTRPSPKNANFGYSVFLESQQRGVCTFGPKPSKPSKLCIFNFSPQKKWSELVSHAPEQGAMNNSPKPSKIHGGKLQRSLRQISRKFRVVESTFCSALML